MLSAIHILLTYACTMKCDHCFHYCAPNAPGTFLLGPRQVYGLPEGRFFI
jgi:MoaA/NifB/PqqE/SkfB family radical SAM enzyme